MEGSGGATTQSTGGSFNPGFNISGGANSFDIKPNLNEFQINYKAYDVVYLDVNDSILYVNHTQIDMDKIDDMVSSYSNSTDVSVYSTGPASFYKVKFLRPYL